MEDSKAHYLNRITTKPPYISISQNKLQGNFGHATVFFRRPIIEGCFFLEFRVKENIQKDRFIFNRSAVRVGICPSTFNPSYPLGYNESIAYKSIDGSIVRNGDKIETADCYRVGDVIGVCLEMSPPSKHPVP